MAAATVDLQTIRRHNSRRIVRYQVDASVKIFNGTIVMLVAGFARPGADTAAAICVGIADETVDNSSGSAGAKSINVVAGIAAKLQNNAGAIVQADIGKSANIVDDNTVTDAATTNNIVAGKIEELDPVDGLPWIYFA